MDQLGRWLGGAPGSGEAALRVEVDRELCDGHGVCQLEAPGVFAVADRTVRMLVDCAPQGQCEQVRRAVAFCPTGALRIVEA